MSLSFSLPFFLPRLPPFATPPLLVGHFHVPTIFFPVEPQHTHKNFPCGCMKCGENSGRHHDCKVQANMTDTLSFTVLHISTLLSPQPMCFHSPLHNSISDPFAPSLTHTCKPLQIFAHHIHHQRSQHCYSFIRRPGIPTAFHDAERGTNGEIHVLHREAARCQKRKSCFICHSIRNPNQPYMELHAFSLWQSTCPRATNG